MKPIQQIYEKYKMGDINIDDVVVGIKKTIEFQMEVCEQINYMDRPKAYTYIECECDELRRIILDQTGYDPEGIDVIQAYNIDSAYLNHEEQILAIADKKGFIEFDDQHKTYKLTLEAIDHTMQALGDDGGDDNGFIVSDVLKYLLDEEIYEIWEDEYYEAHKENRIISDMLLGCSVAALNKSVKAYYGCKFLVKAGVLSDLKKVKYEIPQFASYITGKKSTLISEYIEISFKTKAEPKCIAVTLIALHRLNFLNLDKVNKTKLYNTIMTEFDIEFKGSAVNYHINNENNDNTSGIMAAAIKKEIESIEGLLA